MKNYTINYTDNGITITITKSFAKEAGIYNSEAYNILKGLRADFPDCKVELKKIKRNPEKKTYGKLTYERMEKYIIFVEGEDLSLIHISFFTNSFCGYLPFERYSSIKFSACSDFFSFGIPRNRSSTDIS